MPGRASFRTLTQIVLGLLLVAVGSALTVHLVGWADLSALIPFWPLSLVLVGLAELMPARGRGRLWGLLLIFLGAAFQLWTLDLVAVSPLQLWPLLLVAAGLLVLWIAWRRKNQPPTAGDRLSELGIFAAFHRAVETPAFAGGTLTLILAGCEVDLTQATMAGDEAVVDLVALGGGATFRIPPGWVAVDELSGFFGGIDNRAVHGPEGAPRLVIRGTAILGGADVRR